MVLEAKNEPCAQSWLFFLCSSIYLDASPTLLL